MFHATVIHHEQNHIGLRSADLESEAAAFLAHRGRSAPSGATFAAAHGESAAVFRAEDESGFFHTRHHHDAFRLIQKILGDSFIRRMHHVDQVRSTL